MTLFKVSILNDSSNCRVNESSLAKAFFDKKRLDFGYSLHIQIEGRELDGRNNERRAHITQTKRYKHNITYCPLIIMVKKIPGKKWKAAWEVAGNQVAKEEVGNQVTN